MKTFKAGIRLYINQIICTFLSVFLILPLFSAAQNVPIVFSLITTLIYIAVMYSSAWRVGLKDSRKIPGYFPDPKMPLRLSIITVIIPIILLIIRFAAPNILAVNLPFMRGETDFFVKGCIINGTPDFIYRLWYFPFAAFVPSGSIAAYIAELFVLPVIIYAGYNVGLKKFSLLEFLYAKLVFASDPNKTTGKGKKRRREDNLRR